MDQGDLSFCNQVIAEIRDALQRKTIPVLNVATYQHLSWCGRCRSGLLLLLSALDVSPTHTPLQINCEECQADLAAFIDIEAADPMQAAAIYPHVWWHLWTCPTCAQTYEFTQSLLVAHRSGELASFPPARAPIPHTPPIIRQVRLHRHILRLALPARLPAVAVFRGSDNRYVLFDEASDELERRKFTIVTEEGGNNLWRVLVTIIPPPDGLLMIKFGSLQFVAPFDAQGTATIDSIPADILLETDGPDMEISILAADEG